MCLLFFAWLGCFAVEDPELASYRAAIAQYDMGMVAVEAGKLPEALAAFERAQAIRPEDMLLGAWRAKVLADTGDLEAAIAQLTMVLASRPGFAEARYNRAAYSARLTRFKQAATDVKILLAGDVYTAQDLYEDPDFNAALAQDSFAFVPKAALEAELSLPGHAVVSGTEVPIHLRLRSTTRLSQLRVEGALRGPVRLIRVLEEPSEGALTLSWTLRVVGAGEVQAGPFSVKAHGVDDLLVPAQSFAAWTPPTRVGEESRSLSLRPPSAVVGDRAVPAVWRDADSLYVFTEEGQKVEIKPALGRDPIVFERRRNGVADWVLYEYSLEATQRVDIRITHRGETVLKEQR